MPKEMYVRPLSAFAEAKMDKVDYFKDMKWHSGKAFKNPVGGLGAVAVSDHEVSASGILKDFFLFIFRDPDYGVRGRHQWLQTEERRP